MIPLGGTLYEYSLGIALVLMLFFAFFFLMAKTPDKRIFGNYLCSRCLMAGALLALSANYPAHLFVSPRFQWQEAAIMMNLTTCFYTNDYQLGEDEAMSLLQAVSQPPTEELTSQTQWSALYNLTEETLRLAILREYGKEYQFKVR